MAASAQDDLIGGDSTTELASQRTSLAFDRTRMSADRTLMALNRSGLSMMSFGFAIHALLGDDPASRRLGVAMFAMGVLLIMCGVGVYIAFSQRLTVRREHWRRSQLLHAAPRSSPAPLVLASLLLGVGLVALADIVFHLFQEAP